MNRVVYQVKIEILHELNYTYEAVHFLRNIYSGSTIQKRIKSMEQEYGAKNKAALNKMFAQSFIAQTAIKKNINFAPPGYEKNGKELAEFMFKDRGDYHLFFIDIYDAYQLAVRHNITCKKLAILTAVDDTFFEKYSSCPPASLTESEFFEILHCCNVSDSDKLDTMKLYYNFDMYTSYIDNLVAQVTTIIQEALPNLQNDIDTHMDFIQNQFDISGLGLLTKILGVELEQGLYYVYPSLSIGVAIRSSICKPMEMHFGLHLFSLLKLRETNSTSSEQAEVFLKLIADATKFGIVMLLRDKPMYGTQLAETLNCTNANISHHTNALLDNNIITVRKENSRLYYDLNKESILDRLESVKNLFM